MRPYDGEDDGRIACAHTMGGIMGGMVLKIRPPVLQNGLNIPLEGAFLAQGRINAPPNDHRAASIGVGIVSHPHIMKFSIRALLLGMHQLRLQLRKDQQIPEWRGPKS